MNSKHSRRRDAPRLSLSVLELEDSNYQKVLRGTDNRAVLIDCCATWCGPCKLIEPVLEDAAERWADKLDLIKFDVESGNGEAKLELMLQGVMPRALPALILFHEGKAVAQHKGVITSDDLDVFLESNMPAEVLNGLGKRKKQNSEEKAGTSSAGFVSFASRDDGSDDYMLSGP